MKKNAIWVEETSYGNTALCAVMVYTEEKNVMEELMKAYSVDLREKIVKAHLVENYSIRQVS
ncbi:MAG: hypothetical protein J7545_12335, partial [Roseofilum sp. SBFL]|uniref:hypothetical protein n=1 Tax=Roseofilum sp. SBFL TaxID=2821496 RepID=UPI001B124147